MSIGIYKITNTLNGKYYIGQSSNLEARFSQHKAKAKEGKSMAPLYQAMRESGIENFTYDIIEHCSLEELDHREQYWISYYDSMNPEKGYNVLAGGEKGYMYPPEKFYKLWDEGKTVGEISKTLQVSPTTVRNKLIGYSDYSASASHKRGGCAAYQTACDNGNNHNSGMAVYQYDLQGNFIAEYNSCKEAARVLNVSYSENIRWAARGLRTTAYDYQWSFEKHDKIAPVPKPRGVLIQCIETGKIYSSSKEAAQDVGLKSKTGILLCCQGKQKTAGKMNGQKLTWQYYTPDSKE